MSFPLASFFFRRLVLGSEVQELSDSPPGCPSHFLLRAQEKVTKEKGTPRPRPLRIPAQRVREPRPVFVDRPSLACHEHRRPPCRRPCGLIVRASPLPRGPGQSAGSCPQKRQRASLTLIVDLAIAGPDSESPIPNPESPPP